MTANAAHIACLLVADREGLESSLSAVFARNGVPAVRLLRKGHKSVSDVDSAEAAQDVIFVDGALDDATALVRQLARDSGGIPIIGLLDHPDSAIGEAMLRAGACAYIARSEIDGAGEERRLFAPISALAAVERRRREEVSDIRRKLMDSYDSRERFEAQSTEMVEMAENLERAYRMADRASRDAAETARRLEGVIHTVVDSVLIVRRDGRIDEVNPAAVAMFRRRREQLIGMNVGMLLPGIELHRETEGGRRPSRTQTVFEWQAVEISGEVFPVELSVGALQLDGDILEICVVRDISDRKRIEERIRELALTDPLTKLSNRNAFRSRLDDAMANAQRIGHSVALILMDLNKFKAVNDNFGHPTGDALLIEVANHLKNATRKNDTVARLGGDEFALILGGLGAMDGVRHLLDRIIEAVCTPMVIEGSLINVGASFGVAFFPGDDADAEGLIRKADLALYQAKATGENTYRIYDRHLHRRIRGQKAVEDDLRLALARDEFTLHVQPQIDTASRRVTGLEALVRWRHPTRGLLMPADFIPIAETSGLIGELGMWALSEACRKLALWDSNGHPCKRMAINISINEFRDPKLVGAVRRCLTDHGIAPERIEFEITETAVDSKVGPLIEQLKALREIGVGLAIDDFGTGYASLAYLRRFPVQRLKIDQSFSRNIADDEADAVFVRAIVDLAKGLRLGVIAEGIETEAQAEFFSSVGCLEVQGYYFARPMPIDDYPAWHRAQDSAGRADAGASNSKMS